MPQVNQFLNYIVLWDGVTLNWGPEVQVHVEHVVLSLAYTASTPMAEHLRTMQATFVPMAAANAVQHNTFLSHFSTQWRAHRYNRATGDLQLPAVRFSRGPQNNPLLGASMLGRNVVVAGECPDRCCG